MHIAVHDRADGRADVRLLGCLQGCFARAQQHRQRALPLAPAAAEAALSTTPSHNSAFSCTARHVTAVTTLGSLCIILARPCRASRTSWPRRACACLHICAPSRQPAECSAMVAFVVLRQYGCRCNGVAPMLRLSSGNSSMILLPSRSCFPACPILLRAKSVLALILEILILMYIHNRLNSVSLDFTHRRRRFRPACQ